MRARLRSLRRRLGSAIIVGTFKNLSRLGSLLPASRPAAHGLEVLRDLPYIDDGDPQHTLDVYRQKSREGLKPAVLYLHGGAFQFLSKDTHWLMGLLFARAGYVVFNANYRLAPKAKYPAAIEDACAALLWVKAHAVEYGADPERIVVAGESAGGNLALALVVAASFRRPEPFAQEVFDSGLRVVAAVPACGILQVTDIERLARRRPLPAFVNDRLVECSRGYLEDADTHPPLTLADPLCIIEEVESERPLPPVYTFVGTSDALLDDTRRLKAALDLREVPCEIRYYPKRVHAFHALYWDRAARACWTEQFKVLEAWVNR